MEEEERRRKAIRNAQLIRVSANGIEMMMRGKLTSEQIEAMMEADRVWLEEMSSICGELTEGVGNLDDFD